ncbi:MAG: hypothetical protein J6L86_01280 [Alphaproteobacteria bacterium]|nr:hypothetical protein [Alphaproteobacteria bacterium]
MINKADLFDWILRFAQDDNKKRAQDDNKRKRPGMTGTTGGTHFVQRHVTHGREADSHQLSAPRPEVRVAPMENVIEFLL